MSLRNVLSLLAFAFFATTAHGASSCGSAGDSLPIPLDPPTRTFVTQAFHHGMEQSDDIFRTITLIQQLDWKRSYIATIGPVLYSMKKDPSGSKFKVKVSPTQIEIKTDVINVSSKPSEDPEVAFAEFLERLVIATDPISFSAIDPVSHQLYSAADAYARLVAELEMRNRNALAITHILLMDLDHELRIINSDGSSMTETVRQKMSQREKQAGQSQNFSGDLGLLKVSNLAFEAMLAHRLRIALPKERRRPKGVTALHQLSIEKQTPENAVLLQAAFQKCSPANDQPIPLQIEKLDSAIVTYLDLVDQVYGLGAHRPK